MRGDGKLTPDQAWGMQLAAREAGVLLVWTVMQGTADFGSSVVCRPHLVTDGMTAPVLRYLIAEDLEGLREQLPPGLCRSARSVWDDPVILETWM